MKCPCAFYIFLCGLLKTCYAYSSPNLRKIHVSCLHDNLSKRASASDISEKKFNNAVLAIALSSLTLFTPIPSMALDQNPEALEMRRVMQQPDGAPAQAPAKVAVKLPSGVTYFDYKDGEGAGIVEEGRTVQFQWVLRRSNGYFVDASSNYGDEPFIYKVGNLKKVIPGIDEAIRGMRVGGVRRMNIPPKSAFIAGVGDDKPGPMPAGFGPRRQIETRIDKEVWYFEIKVLKVR
jgi:hypothetical protein